MLGKSKWSLTYFIIQNMAFIIIEYISVIQKIQTDQIGQAI